MIGETDGPSLLEGWLPLSFQLLVVALICVSIEWMALRTERRWLAVSVATGAATTSAMAWGFLGSGWSTDGSPVLLWVWIGFAVTWLMIVITRWSRTALWRRTLSMAMVPLCLAAAAVVVNQWTGYFATTSDAAKEITSDGGVNSESLAGLRDSGPAPRGRLVEMTTPSTISHFDHRAEFVYLPPVWFDGIDPPQLPVSLMIGGEFGTPTDWIRIGGAVTVAQQYAASHGGYAPILVFPDANGTFYNDTECVDGTRGNAADHLTGEVIPFVQSTFHTSTDPRRWAVVGWSMGGTCALDLAVMHPELIDTFVDIAGDAEPLDGDREQTIDRLYGGDRAQWMRFFPNAVIAAHTHYADTAAWFDDSSDPQPSTSSAFPEAPATMQPNQHLLEAQDLCGRARTRGIDCTIHTQPGPHDWQFAAAALRSALPWVAARITA